MAEGLPNYRDPNGDRALAKRITEIEDSITALRRALGVGLVVDGATGDLHVAGARNIRLGTKDGDSGAVITSSFDGTDFDDAGTQGNYYGDDGAVLNALKLRPGSIDNEILANPVIPNVVNQVATNFAIPGTSDTTIVSFNAIVPDNCTRLLAHLTGDAFVVNPNTTGGSNGAGSDIIIARCAVEATTGLAMGTSISGSNGQTSVHCSLASLLTGLTPGDTITLAVTARAGFQSFGGPNTSNQANLSASLLWLR